MTCYLLITILFTYQTLIEMRLFVHLINFPQDKIPSLKQLKILQKNDRKRNSHVIILHVSNLSTTDQLIKHICNRLKIQEKELVMKLVYVGRLEEKRIRIIKGKDLKQYISAFGQYQQSVYEYQLEVQVEYLVQMNHSKQQKTQDKQQGKDSYEDNNFELSETAAEIYKFSNRLFQTLQKDEINQFKNILNLLINSKRYSMIKVMFSMYHIQNGFTLILLAIFYNKNEFLEEMLKQFGQFIDMNLKSVDGWLPFQLILSTSNKKSLEILINANYININLNFESSQGRIIFNLIDTINIDLIKQTVKRFPIYFEQLDHLSKMNCYDYIWNHDRFLQHQKKQLIQLMHQKHLQMYDYYRLDMILFSQCKKYFPTASRRSSPKKEIIYNPNLKIVSGELIKCRTPPHFSKNVFISVNSYIGAFEQYEISSKLQLQSDCDKIQQYKKDKHLSLQQIQSIQMLETKDKSWYMKKEWCCFVIKEKRDVKTLYACLHQSTANHWIGEIKQAIDAWNSHQHKYGNYKIAKNYIKITDQQIKIQTTKKIQGPGFIQMFTKRLSLCEPTINKNQLSTSQMDIPVVKSKSHYNTTNNSSLAVNEEILPLSLKYSDFKMLQILGQGSFGQVFLVECLKNKKFYALKTFQKKKIILSKQTKFVISEVNILKQIKHPFIIKLHFTFQTPNYIYLGLEYCQGKDLSKHINEQIVFPEEDVKIYAAEIVLALEYLHNIGIIYRDLKPQNIMLGRDGHVLLVDFGLSKKTENNFAKTFCGSPAYLSPEMLEKKGVGPQTDFFSLGVVIFELIFGQPPFYADNIHVLYQNIQNGIISFPSKINPQTKRFLQKLLEKQPKNRLGSGSINQIKNHEYFSNICWQKLYNKQIKAPKRTILQELSQVQSEQQLINMFHNDFDYSEQNYRINRFRNFSFVREDQFN